jgi:hypothetical protein
MSRNTYFLRCPPRWPIEVRPLLSNPRLKLSADRDCPYSRWNLFGDQIEGCHYYCRVWRSVLPHWTSESSFGACPPAPLRVPLSIVSPFSSSSLPYFHPHPTQSFRHQPAHLLLPLATPLISDYDLSDRLPSKLKPSKSLMMLSRKPWPRCPIAESSGCTVAGLSKVLLEFCFLTRRPDTAIWMSGRGTSGVLL